MIASKVQVCIYIYTQRCTKLKSGLKHGSGLAV